MLDLFSSLSSPVQALIATGLTWLLTALGALPVLFFAKVKATFMDALLAFAAGVMTAASFWSLLLPSVEYAQELSMSAPLMVISGFVSGGLLLHFGGCICNRLTKKTEADSDARKRTIMLIFAITLHNIPEGMAIGVAFGALAVPNEPAALTAAIMLAIGIGIQNIPEGMAVSLPLLREGLGRKKAFFFGQLSGLAEPVAGVLGAILVISARQILPFMLAFAAGAMIFVVFDDLIPESSKNKCRSLMTAAAMLGFTAMTFLDLAAG